ncbi:threonine aldolase family protein [Moraxella canis]|uniref:threonine aldolase family protein n=1 Tax=Moraxella canis TaxID=90239 RepID=UPI00066685DC|nr:beta-eliminating lyase-related protein [Moraxella canis]
MKHFASDNYAGVHPTIMQALIDANQGHEMAYGADSITARLDDLIRREFGEQAVGYPVFNGTGANVLGLQSLMPRYGSVICAETAHINQDESNAPQAVGGYKLWTVRSDDGKLTPEMIAPYAQGFGNEHRAQPLVLYISQVTECGTCYTVDELAALAEFVHERGMKLFVDGARLANAASYLDVSFYEMITKTGVDMVAFGGTKNGLMFGECLIDVKGVMSNEMKFLRKMSMQTASKMRFISAQLIALFQDDLYRSLANHSNQMAKYLSDELLKLDGASLVYPVESNGVFIKMKQDHIAKARTQSNFYDWHDDSVRLMCSFDTTKADIDALIGAIKNDSH